MIKKEDMGVWEEKLKEGETYIMHNFKLLKNRAQYRVCEHPFKLLFIGATSIRPQPIASIPRKLWKFKSIKDIIDGKYCVDLLVGKFIVVSLCMCPIFIFIVNLLIFLHVRCDWYAGQCRGERPFQKMLCLTSKI